MTGAPPVVLREARVEDAAGLARVHVDGWRLGYAGLLPASLLDGLDADARAARWERNLREPAHASVRTWVAVVDREVAGFVSAGAGRDPGFEEVGEIWALYVHPDRWRAGIGGVLMEHALGELRGAGFEEAFVWVLEGNQRARGFYSRWGFAEDGGTKVASKDGVPLHERRMRRSLA